MLPLLGQHAKKMELQDKISLDSKLLLDILENISTAVVVLNEDDSYFFVNTATYSESVVIFPNCPL